MELYFPSEVGERIAFICAAVTILLGLLTFLRPSLALRIAAFQVGEVRPEGYAATRAAGARDMALGLLPLLLAQDWFYMTLGVVLGFGVIGRLASCLFDRGITKTNIAILLLQVVIAAGPLAYAFGYI